VAVSDGLAVGLGAAEAVPVAVGVGLGVGEAGVLDGADDPGTALHAASTAAARTPTTTDARDPSRLMTPG
jgi:hypothetical protein